MVWSGLCGLYVHTIVRLQSKGHAHSRRDIQKTHADCFIFKKLFLKGCTREIYFRCSLINWSQLCTFMLFLAPAKYIKFQHCSRENIGFRDWAFEVFQHCIQEIYCCYSPEATYWGKKIYNPCDLKSIHKGIIPLIERDQNCSFYVSNLNSLNHQDEYIQLSHPVQPTTLLQKSLIVFDIIMRFMSSSHHLTGWQSTECIKIKLTVLTHSLKLKPSLLVSGCSSEDHLLSFYVMVFLIHF